MEKVIEQIDGLIATLEKVPASERTTFLGIAAGRLDAAKGRVREHLDEMKKRKEATARVVSEKEAELARLKTGTA